MKFILLFLISINTVAQSLTVTEKVKFLALGDSYTIGQGVSVQERWPNQFIDSLKKRGIDCHDPRTIATTGWRTDQLKQAITTANLTNDYNLVSLLIGVNNQYQGRSLADYAIEFEELLNRAIELGGGKSSTVFVLSIPDYGYTPFGASQQEKISRAIAEFNQVNRHIANALGVLYIDITPISQRGLIEPDLIATDRLHPSGKMYAEWVALLLKDMVVIESEEVITDVEKRYDEASIHIYPNPFQHELTVKVNTPLKFQLTNSLGVVQWQHDVTTDLSLETKNLPVGIYFYRFINVNQVVQHGKLIKK